MKSAFRRFCKWFIAVTVVTVILLTTLYLFRNTIFAPHIQSFLENSIESQLGMRLNIAGIGGSYFRDFVLTNVTTAKPAPDGPLTALEFKRLRLAYNPLSLFKGLDVFVSEAAIELNGANLKLDFSREKEVSEAPSKPDSSPSLFLPDRLPRIRIQDTTVVLQGSGYATDFKGIELQTVDARPLTDTLRLRISQWSWNHPDLQDGNTPVSAVIEYFADQITVKNLNLGEKQIVEFAQVGLKALPEMIPFKLNLNLAGGQASLDGKLDHSNLVARINAEHLDLARIFSLFSPPKPQVTGILSLKADIGLPNQRLADLAADLDLKLTRANIYGLAADELVLRAGTKEGQVRLDMFDLRTGANKIVFTEVSVPATEAFEGNVPGLLETAQGSFSIDCRDVPSLLLLGDVNLSETVDSIPAHRLLLNGEFRHGEIILSDGGLTTDSGYIHLDSSRIGLPIRNRPFKDAPIQAVLKMDFSNLELLSRIFAIPPLGGSVQGNAAVTGTPGSPSGTASITASKISFQDMTYGDLAVKVHADSHSIVVESVALQRGKDRLTGQGKFHYATQELEDAVCEFQITDLAAYAGKLWPENWRFAGGKPRIRGSLAGKAAMTGPFNMPRGTVALQARKIALEDTGFGDAELRLYSDGQKITVENLEIRQHKDRVTLKGSIDLKTQELDQVDVDIAVADVGAYLKNFLPKDQWINGSIRANITASGPFDEPRARADVNLKHLKFGDMDIPSATLKAHSSGRRIAIDKAEVDAPWSRVTLGGNLLRRPADTEFDFELTTLKLSGHGLLLALQNPAHIRFARNGEFSVTDISLGGPAGSIQLKGTVSSQKKADIHILLSDVDSKGWFDSLATDRLRFSGLNARIHLSGSADSPALKITGDLARIGSTLDPIFLTGRFDLSYTKTKVIIRQFEWSSRDRQRIAITGSIPFEFVDRPGPAPGPLSIDATFELPELDMFHVYYPHYLPAAGSLQGEIHMTGTWNAPAGKLLLQCRGLKPPPQLKPSPPGVFDIDGNIRLDGKQVVVESIRIESPALTLTSKGKWNGIPALIELLQGGPRTLEGDVALTADLKVADLSWIAEGTEELRRVAGRLEANMTLQGPVSDPKLNATVRLVDAELRPAMDVPSLQSLNLSAGLTPRRIQLDQLRGELGGAPFSITGNVTRNQDSGGRVDLRLQGENLLLYRAEGLRLRADTDLTVTGPFSRLELAGEVAITDGYFGKYFDLLSTLRGSSKPKTSSGLQLFSIRQSPFKEARFDVRITSKQPFRIRNNLVAGAVRPELKLSGTGEIPFLTGKVYLDPTRLSLPSGNLRFESGVVRFDETKPDRPTLDLMAQSRMFGYDMTLLVEGPYDEPVVTLSSVPPLSNEELLLMLLTGQPPQTTAGQTRAQGQNINVAMYIGKDLIARWFSNDSETDLTSIVDRFDIEVGRGVTREGDETINAQFRIAEDVLRDGDTLYITGEKDVFDFYNAGVRILFRFK